MTRRKFPRPYADKWLLAFRRGMAVWESPHDTYAEAVEAAAQRELEGVSLEGVFAPDQAWEVSYDRAQFQRDVNACKERIKAWVCPHPVTLIALDDLTPYEGALLIGRAKAYCPDCRSYVGVVRISGLSNSSEHTYQPYPKAIPAPPQEHPHG